MATESHGFAEFHDELRSVAGDVLAKDGVVDWPVLSDAGWTGLEVPEEFGGAGADHILMVADGVVAVATPDVTPRPVLDETRRLATVSPGTGDHPQVLRFEGDPQRAVRSLHDRAAVAVACDSLGLAEAMLSATVSYVKVREQFGRPVGSFQAVKHACADMLVEIAVSRQLLGNAVDAVSHGAPGAGVAAAMAKSHVCDAAVAVVGKAMQLHGGIGYTWESGLHVYLKRAALNRSLFGSGTAHRKQLTHRYR